MVGIKENILPPSLKSQLSGIRQTNAAFETASLRLASGQRVASVFDDPINFVAAKNLREQSSDLTRLRDSISLSKRVIENTLDATKTLEKLLQQTESIVRTTQEELSAGISTEDLSFIEEEEFDLNIPVLQNEILQDNPVAYYRLNETSGTTAQESTGTAGTFDASYQNGVNLGAEPLYKNNGTFSADFDGINDFVAVPDSGLINTSPTAQRSVELTFNADEIASRQVLYEEGAGVNGFTIYIDDGNLRVTAEDDDGANRFFDIDIKAPIEAGKTYNVGFVFDRFTSSFTGYLNGQEIGSVSVFNENFPSHSGDIGIGAANQSVQFHDGESSVSQGFHFNGRISDVAIYNNALTAEDFERRTQALQDPTGIRFINTEYDELRNQIDNLVGDSRFNGINLLKGDELLTFFNADRSSFLNIQGVDLSADSLKLERFNFNDPVEVGNILNDVREALQKTRNFGRRLTTGLNSITIRETFIKETINTFTLAADDLTQANQNEEAVKLLQSQTSRQLQFALLGSGGSSLADILV